jgi:hypothetical protein
MSAAQAFRSMTGARAYAEQIKSAADEVRKQEAKTNSLAKEFTSTDPAQIDGKIAEIQGKLEAGGLAFKAEKVCVMRVLLGLT